MPAGNPGGYIAEGGNIRLTPLAKSIATVQAANQANNVNAGS